MSIESLVQIAGSLLILVPFVLVQLRRMRTDTTTYAALNLVGSAVLAVDALHGHQWGFLLLEGDLGGRVGVRARASGTSGGALVPTSVGRGGRPWSDRIGSWTATRSSCPPGRSTTGRAGRPTGGRWCSCTGSSSTTRLWSDVPERLAKAGFHTFAPTWPLASHTTAMKPGADLSPRGVARVVASFLEALDLHDVTIVGSDTGGAVSQLLLDEDRSRVGRLVLTNCDAFDSFPPAPFGALFRVARHPVPGHGPDAADALELPAAQQARLRRAGPAPARGRGEPALGDAVPHRQRRTPGRHDVREGMATPTSWSTRRGGSRPSTSRCCCAGRPSDPFFKLRPREAAAGDLPGRDPGRVPRRAHVRLPGPAGAAGRGDRALAGLASPL